MVEAERIYRDVDLYAKVRRAVSNKVCRKRLTKAQTIFGLVSLPEVFSNCASVRQTDVNNAGLLALCVSPQGRGLTCRGLQRQFTLFGLNGRWISVKLSQLCSVLLPVE